LTVSKGLGVPSHAFEIKEVTMPALWERFANVPVDKQAQVLRPAEKDDIAIYVSVIVFQLSDY
jgi:hypothetical protein